MAFLNDSQSFKTYVIIEFDNKCSISVKKWLEKKLSSSKENNGSDFLTLFSKNHKNEEVYLHVGATTKRFLKGAEEIGLKKRYKNETIRDFLVDDLNNFENSDKLDQFLSQSDCLKVIDYELNCLKHDNIETQLDETVLINHFDGIINQLKERKIIRKVFPIHDKNEITTLKRKWYESIKAYTPFRNIPTENIRNYFGESVAIYFNFFEFYTKALYSFAIIGLITWLLPFSSFSKFVFNSVFNIIWNTIFMEIWKRRTAELNFKWGLFDLNLNDKPRPQFKGVPGLNPITNKPEIVYPKNKRMLKKYIVTYPIIGISIVLAYLLMIAYYIVQEKVDLAFDQNQLIDKIAIATPSIVYSFVVIPLSEVYKIVAIKLNDWENHRTQASYESNLTTKLFVFYFANSFLCLFYEGFFRKNFSNLSSLLISMLIVNALINKLTEVFAPYLKKKIKKRILASNEKSKLNKEKSEVEKESYVLDEYEGTYSDYVTLFEQYGYMVLFSAVFPWVSLCALANNIMEQRSDAFKYCHVNQRPFPVANSNGIGPWETAFDLLGIISITTNIALIALHPEVREHLSGFSEIEYFALFVLIEHILILIKIAIMFGIPNESREIFLAKQRYKYESIEAFKKERMAGSSKLKQQ